MILGSDLGPYKLSAHVLRLKIFYLHPKRFFIRINPAKFIIISFYMLSQKLYQHSTTSLRPLELPNSSFSSSRDDCRLQSARFPNMVTPPIVRASNSRRANSPAAEAEVRVKRYFINMPRALKQSRLFDRISVPFISGSTVANSGYVSRRGSLIQK